MCAHPPRLGVLALSLLLSAGALWLAQPSPLGGQTGGSSKPDPEAQETHYRQAFEAALEVPEDEPMAFLLAWNTAFQSAIMLDQVRALASGDDGKRLGVEAVRAGVLEEWKTRRPESLGPEVLPTTWIQDPEARKQAALALLDRHPDDLLVAWNAWAQLRRSREGGRATEVLEAFRARHPREPAIYRLLVQDARGHETRRAEILAAWARVSPGDPELLSTWLRSGMARRDPDTTADLIAAFFAGEPAGAKGLGACLELSGHPSASVAAQARACIARIAGDPASPPEVAERATSALVRSAAQAGDWQGLVSALEDLDPEARWRALASAARQLPAPQQCEARTYLVEAAWSNRPQDPDAGRSLAGALKDCSSQPAARELFLDLLRSAPDHAAEGIVRSWTLRLNDELTGDLPTGTITLLEDRLRAEPGADGLFEALETAYEVEGAEEKRFQLLLRRHGADPSSLDSRRATALARGLVERGRPEEAITLLREHVRERWTTEAVELLWGLMLETGDTDGMAELEDAFTSSGKPGRMYVGHLLTARSAVLAGDLDSAREHYLQALESEYARREVAVEMLVAVAGGDKTQAMESLAETACRETRLAPHPSGVSDCTAELLKRAGAPGAVSTVLESAALAAGPAAADRPDSLRRRARSASAAGRHQVAEEAARRLLEVDPLNQGNWTFLGSILEAAGRSEELEQLLYHAAERFSAPPLELYRAAGRALTASGRLPRAIEILREAQTLALRSGNEATDAWLRQDLRKAYRALGLQARSRRATAGAASGRQPPSDTVHTPGSHPLPTGAAAELRRAAEAFYSGSGGVYDPAAAAELLRRATAMGDPLATYRLALLAQLKPQQAATGGVGAGELHAHSARAVEALAAEGDAYAQYLVGTAALIGVGGPPDLAAARRWLEAAAAEGQSWAWHNLAWMEQTGRGFSSSDAASVLNSYRRAARMGNAESMHSFAVLALTPQNAGEICREGLAWLERAAGTGHAVAAHLLGRVLLFGRGECVPRDPAAAVPWLEAAASARQPGARTELPFALLAAGAREGAPAGGPAPGHDFTRRGLRVLEELAGDGDVLALEMLAFLHATGAWNAPRDPDRARLYLERAAGWGSDGLSRIRRSRQPSSIPALLAEGHERLERLAGEGDAAVRAWLAWLTSLGVGVPADPHRALALARPAAEEGEPLALRVLSGAYARGEGVEPDPVEATRWRRRCAEAGDPFCMMFYSQALRKGEGVERDPEAALLWLRRAAEAGNWWAMADMGHFLDEGGPGIPRDLEAAARWKRILAERGDPESRGWLTYHASELGSR